MNRFDYLQFGAKSMAKRGADLPQTKLTPEQVETIKINRYGKTAKQLAADHGVHFRTIEKIRHRETHTL